jgi:hypothetical protein
METDSLIKKIKIPVITTNYVGINKKLGHYVCVLFYDGIVVNFKNNQKPKKYILTIYLEGCSPGYSGQRSVGMTS